jgi:hypothetical protein
MDRCRYDDRADSGRRKTRGGGLFSSAAIE